MTDEQLMRLIIKREKSAFEELYDRYNILLLNYFYRMLWRDREKAEDFMQDLFTRIIAKPEYFDTEKNFKTWIYSVANNMCKNEYKKQEVRKKNEYKIFDSAETMTGSSEYIKNIDKRSFNEAVDKELNKLKETEKTAFILRFREELSIREIGEIMECSEGTVKSRLYYTIKKLTPRLKMFKPV
ncbi:MAG: RNA polymerase subunit sigma-70 [Marinilabiliales bacterium]|nr:MAG: RNA polymerase subunit sigma-70 [Marinilabiliales bacterium]